jgi:hypothetical protein
MRCQVRQVLEAVRVQGAAQVSRLLGRLGRYGCRHFPSNQQYPRSAKGVTRGSFVPLWRAPPWACLRTCLPCSAQAGRKGEVRPETPRAEPHHHLRGCIFALTPSPIVDTVARSGQDVGTAALEEAPRRSLRHASPESRCQRGRRAQGSLGPAF